MTAFAVAAVVLVLLLGLLIFRLRRCPPAERMGAAGGVVALAFLLCHGFQVLAAVRFAEARDNLALLGAKATARDEAFGILVILQPSFAGFLMLAAVVLAAGALTVGRRPGVNLPAVLGGLALLVAVPMALGSLPLPGPAPERAVGAIPIDPSLHPVFGLAAAERRFGMALPLLVLAAAAAVLHARRERLAAAASGTPEEREDARRVQAGSGLLLFTTAALLVEVLVVAPCESAVIWGPAARKGWDLALPWVLGAILPGIACAAGMFVSLRHGYHGMRRRKRP